MKKLRLVSDPTTVNSALEIWFIQNRVLGGLPITLLQDAVGLENHVIVYLELAGADLNFLRYLKSKNNKIVLFQMGDEYGKKSRDAYELCDLIVKNYYFHELFEDSQ